MKTPNLLFNVASIVTMIKSNMLSLSSDAQTTVEFIDEMKEETYFETISTRSQDFINEIRNMLNVITSKDSYVNKEPIPYDIHGEEVQLPMAAENPVPQR